jgi:cytochrome c oxidase cbb3-type subunit 3
MPDPNKRPPAEDPLRHHSYDGIQEYDKRLPNWWLFTLYGAIAFSLVYWLFYHLTGVGMTDREALTRAMDAVQEARLAGSMGTLGDDELWKLSRDAKLVEAGRATFRTNCAACHLVSLRGKEENPTAIGPSLVDATWIHGGTPSEVRQVITRGVLEKGMPAWGPVLGDRKVVELMAFVMNHHEPPASVATP